MSLLNFDPKSERIQQAHKRLRDAYNRVPGHVVPVVDPGLRAPGKTYPEKEALADPEKMLVNAVSWANGLASSDQDWPPFINTYCGVVMVAEAFGCKIVFDDFGTAWTEPVSSNIEAVDRIRPMRPDQTPLIRCLNTWVDFAQRRLGTELPIWTMDVQSPFSVAAHIIEPMELLMACISDPERVHKLCRMITDFSITMMREHIAQMEHPAFPGRNFPSISDRIGICIADDTPLVMLSPEMYREFAMPYNAEVGAAFGGIHIHSCGDYRINLENLIITPGVRSIQLHAGVGEFRLPETPAEDCAFNRARQKVTYLVDTNDISRGQDYKGRGRDHYRDYVLPRLKTANLTGCILQSCGPGNGLADHQAAIDWTREQVKT